MEGATIDILTVLNYPLSLEIFWKEWFTAYPGREVFDRSIEDRIFIDNSAKFLSHVSQCKKRRQPCWLSVQPFQCRNRAYSLEKLFFDFDSKTDIRKAWVETKHFVASLERFYNVRPLICFSGRKGYHVYVWLKEPFIIPD